MAEDFSDRSWRQWMRFKPNDLSVDDIFDHLRQVHTQAAQDAETLRISRDSSDFVADCLELWWTNRQAAHRGVHRLLIDLDNGPEIASSRTQFMKRLVEFSDRHQLTLELACYPPYHSKYNPIERCWGILENHSNGALLRPRASRM